MPSCLRSINISKGKKLSIRNMKQQQGHDPGLFVEKIFFWVIEVPEEPQAGLSDNLGCTLETEFFFFKSLLSPVWIVHIQSNLNLLKHVGLWHSFG